MSLRNIREKPTRVKVGAAESVCMLLERRLKRELWSKAIAQAAEEASSGVNHSVPLGFYNGSVQSCYLHSLECEKMEKLTHVFTSKQVK